MAIVIPSNDPVERKRRAIQMSRKMGMRIGKDSRLMEKIAEDYDDGGFSQRELADKYLPVVVRKSPSTARSAIAYALREFLSVEDSVRIAARHNSKAGREHFKRLGDEFGKKNYAEGKGLAGISYEDRVKNGRLGAEQRGCVLYDVKKKSTGTKLGMAFEKDYIIHLRDLGLSWKAVAHESNRVYGNDRTDKSLSPVYNKWTREASSGKKI